MQEAKIWKHKDIPTKTRTRAARTVGKVITSVFWDSDGILQIDYMPSKATINGLYYAEIKGQIREAMKQKRRGKQTAGVLHFMTIAGSLPVSA